MALGLTVVAFLVPQLANVASLATAAHFVATPSFDLHDLVLNEYQQDDIYRRLVWVYLTF
jgi:hypothetical protein